MLLLLFITLFCFIIDWWCLWDVELFNVGLY